MTISVAMTTYKSKKYVKEQLESIWNQTRLPDQIVICDDASPDDTFEYVQELTCSAPQSIKIILKKNENNLGYLNNFEQAYSLCDGDIIVSCDADDIWMPTKIEKLVSCFEKDASVVMAFSDAHVIDSNGKVIQDSLNAGWDTRENKQSALELSLLSARRKGCVYGMEMCFSRELIQHAMPFCRNCGYDEWLSMLASCYGRIAYIDEKLVKYRRHATNTTGQKKSIKERIRTYNREQWFTHAQDIRDAFKEFLKRYNDKLDEKLRSEIQQQLRFQSVLVDIVDGKPLGGAKLLKEYIEGRYTRYRGTWKTFVLDEVYLIRH